MPNHPSLNWRREESSCQPRPPFTSALSFNSVPVPVYFMFPFHKVHSLLSGTGFEIHLMMRSQEFVALFSSWTLHLSLPLIWKAPKSAKGYWTRVPVLVSQRPVCPETILVTIRAATASFSPKNYRQAWRWQSGQYGKTLRRCCSLAFTMLQPVLLRLFMKK